MYRDDPAHDRRNTPCDLSQSNDAWLYCNIYVKNMQELKGGKKRIVNKIFPNLRRQERNPVNIFSICLGFVEKLLTNHPKEAIIT